MKNCNYIFIFCICFLCFISFKMQSQQIDSNTHIINQYFQLNKESASVVNSYIRGVQPQINEVTLNQVGNNNKIEVKSVGNDSQGVNQVGNNNYYQFINYYNNTPSNFNILQQGNSNSLQIYGENSIINNIGIVQKSNFKTLIIKNY